MSGYYPEDYKADLESVRRNFEREVHMGVAFNGHLERKHLIGVPSYHKELFVYCLMLEVLIDEAVFTYFRQDYDRFIVIVGRALPKFEFCGHGRLNSDPFSILYILESPVTSLNHMDTSDTDYFRSMCREVMVMFIRSIREGQFTDLTVENLYRAIENDGDIVNEMLGKVFIQEFKRLNLQHGVLRHRSVAGPRGELFN